MSGIEPKSWIHIMIDQKLTFMSCYWHLSKANVKRSVNKAKYVERVVYLTCPDMIRWKESGKDLQDRASQRNIVLTGAIIVWPHFLRLFNGSKWIKKGLKGLSQYCLRTASKMLKGLFFRFCTSLSHMCVWFLLFPLGIM